MLLKSWEKSKVYNIQSVVKVNKVKYIMNNVDIERMRETKCLRVITDHVTTKMPETIQDI